MEIFFEKDVILIMIRNIALLPEHIKLISARFTIRNIHAFDHLPHVIL
jgi:hypothetical protein